MNERRRKGEEEAKEGMRVKDIKEIKERKGMYGKERKQNEERKAGRKQK